MNPCYSGFQVQGTATAPTGMTPSDTQNAAIHSYYIIADILGKYKYFEKNILRHDKSATEIQDLARDKACILRAKEQCGTRNLLGTSKA